MILPPTYEVFNDMLITNFIKTKLQGGREEADLPIPSMNTVRISRVYRNRAVLDYLKSTFERCPEDIDSKLISKAGPLHKAFKGMFRHYKNKIHWQ